MTDPVDTDALRDLAVQHEEPQKVEDDVSPEVRDATGLALRSAADEVDRLRAVNSINSRFLSGSARWSNEAIDRASAAEAEASRLRTVIENAPHQYPCPHQTRAWLVSKCTCWKADVL